jgi:multiple RNA-binding domain-containing protein 1
VDKSELLDREAADVAVRLALGEARVIAETKRDLGDAGVAVGTLEQAAAAAGKGGEPGG